MAHIKIIFLFLMLVPSLSVNAACNSNVPTDKPDARYEELDGSNGQEVTDTRTGLIWQRCVLGMQWDGSACIGIYNTYTWKSALDMARTTRNNSSSKNWRLPSVAELYTLPDRSCKSPAINTYWFNGIPSVWTWTSSPDINASDSAWFVDFSSGAIGTIAKTQTFPIRLVRNK